METTTEPKHEYLTTPTGAKQVLCPPETPAYNPEWLSERERYLLENGWEKEPSIQGLPTYRDSKGSKLQGEIRKVKDLPNKGDDLNPTFPLFQFHVPPATYSFTLEEAVDMQRRRDATGDGGPTALQRLEATEQRCNRLEQELQDVKGRVKAIIHNRQISLDGVRLALRELVGE